MAKFQIDAMLDAALSYVSSNANEYYVCTTQPTTRAEAITNSVVAAQTPGYTGPADGDTNGRKLTVNALTDVSITADGTVQHLALCSGTTLIYVTTTTSQAVSSGGTVSVPAWDIEIADVA